MEKFHSSLAIDDSKESITYNKRYLAPYCSVAHAQFESIHPFLDGNGRLGTYFNCFDVGSRRIVELPDFLWSEGIGKREDPIL